MGISAALQFLANDFQYSKYYMDAGRWRQLELFRNLEEIHKINVRNAEAGHIYRGSILDPPSIEKYNPIVEGAGTYNWWAVQNLNWMKKNAQLDCSKEPCWLERTSPKWKQFKGKLLGKLAFVGDIELMYEVSQWKE